MLADEAQEQNVKTVQMKTVQWRQLRRSSVFIVKCKHISHFVLTDDFEQANVCWVHIKNASTFEGKIKYIMC